MKSLVMKKKKYRQVKYTAEWGGRKTILQVVSMVSTAILGFLMYRFAQQGHWLYFSGTGTAFLLTGYVFLLLLKEIQYGKKSAERLRTQREYYRITISSMAEGVVTTDQQGEIRYMNPAAERMTGWKLDEAKKLPLQTVYSVVNEETGEPLEHIVSRILRNRQKVDLENNTVLNTKEKGKLIISNSGSPLFDNNGNMAGAVLVFNDITEKKKTETALKESEKQYRSLIQNLPEAMYTCDANGYIKLYNKAARELWGREPNTGKDRWCGSCKILNTGGSVLQPDSFPVKRAMTERRPLEEQEIIIQRPDGSSRHVLSYPTPLFDASGRLTGAVNMLIDVTEKKEKELLIIHSEEKYRSLIEEASDAILIYSFDGTIHEFNKRCYVLLGYSQEEYAHLKLNDILIEDIIINQANYAAILAGDTKTVYRHLKRKDGSVIEAEVTVKLMADGRVISFTRDITERRKAEEAVRKEKKLLESVINSLPGIFYLLDQNHSFIRWNKNFETVSGYNHNEIADMLAYDFVDEDEKLIMPEKIRDVMTRGEVYRYANFCTKDHKKIPYYFTAFKMENEGEIQIIGMGLDITELKNAESKMKTAIERYDILARATSDTIWDWDMGNNKILYNEGITQMFGYQPSEVDNMVNWWNDKLHPDDVKKLTELLIDVYEKGAGRFQTTYRFRCADGAYKYIYDRAFVIYDADQKPVRMIGAMQDITSAKEEEKRIEKAIMDAQEQERRYIGQELHDNVNQILAGSLLCLGMAKDNLADPEKSLEFTDLSKEYVINAINEIRKLSHELVPTSFDDNTLKDIFETLLLGINLDKRFAIKFHFDEDINKSAGEDIQISLYRILQEQVKNILKYADADTLEVEVTLVNGTARMRICDNGKGFDASIAKRGIGLSNMKKRAESLDGKFMINTRPGKGCEIIIEIPLNHG